MCTINDLVYDINAKFIKRSNELEVEFKNQLAMLNELVSDSRLNKLIETKLTDNYSEKLENLTTIYNIALSTLYAMS